MEKETFDRFLSLQGVMGVAVLGRKTRPYFFRSFQELGRRQQDALGEGLFQVLDSMPAGFDFFDFQFAEQRVFVYPLAQQWVLLVAVNHTLVMPLFQVEVNKLRSLLSQDPHKGLTTLRGIMTQLEGSTALGQSASEGTPLVGNPSQDLLGDSSTSREPLVADIVRELNLLCQASTNFLGKPVIVNYWKAARQDIIDSIQGSAALLSGFEVDRTAQIRYTGELQKLNETQHQLLRSWVAAFVRRCGEVNHNFRSLLQGQQVNPQEWDHPS